MWHFLRIGLDLAQVQVDFKLLVLGVHYALATTTSANNADFLQCSTADIKVKAALASLSAVVLLACLIALFFYCIQRLSGGKKSII